MGEIIKTDYRLIKPNQRFGSKNPLNSNLSAIVDACNFDRLNQFHWSMVRGKHNKSPYAIRYQNIDDIKTRFVMHHEIISIPPGMEPDHVNGKGLDNRRENIRLATHQKNMVNRFKKNPTGFHGVNKTRSGNYFARRNRKYLGTFPTAEAAALAYNNAAQDAYGEFAYLNKV